MAIRAHMSPVFAQHLAAPLSHGKFIKTLFTYGEVDVKEMSNPDLAISLSSRIRP